MKKIKLKKSGIEIKLNDINGEFVEAYESARQMKFRFDEVVHDIETGRNKKQTARVKQTKVIQPMIVLDYLDLILESATLKGVDVTTDAMWLKKLNGADYIQLHNEVEKMVVELGLA